MSSANPSAPRTGADEPRAHEHESREPFRFQYRAGVARVADGDREIVVQVAPRGYLHVSASQRSIVAGTREDRERKLRDLESRYAHKFDAALRMASEAAAAFDPAREELDRPERRNGHVPMVPVPTPEPPQSPPRPAAPATTPTPPPPARTPESQPTAPNEAKSAEEPEASADDPFGSTTSRSPSPPGAALPGAVPLAKSDTLRALQLRLLQRAQSPGEALAASPPRPAPPPPSPTPAAADGPAVASVREPRDRTAAKVFTKHRRRTRHYKGQMFLWPGFGDASREQIIRRPEVIAAAGLLQRYAIYNAAQIVLQVGPEKPREAVAWFHRHGGEQTFRDPAAAIAKYCLKGLGRRLAGPEQQEADDEEIPFGSRCGPTTEPEQGRQEYKERAGAC